MTPGQTHACDFQHLTVQPLRYALCLLTWIFLSWLSPSTLSATADPGLPKLQPSGVTAYDVEDGLPITCTFSGILDANDQLWINACFGQEEHRKTNFYRFDGKSAFSIDWQDRPDGQYEQAVLSGFFPDGRLYGFFRHSPLGFVYDRKTQQATYFECHQADAQIYFIGFDDQERLIIYAIAPHSHLIYIRELADLILWTTLDRAEVDFPHGNDWWFPQSHLVAGSDFWFFDRSSTSRDDTLVHVNLRTGNLQKVSLHTAAIHAAQGSDTHGGRLLIDAAGRLQAFLPDPGIRYLLDARTGTRLSGPVSLPSSTGGNMNQIATSPIWCDDHGNILYLVSSNASGLTAILEDVDGRQYDYSPILKAATEASRFPTGGIRSVCGRDLLSQAYVFGDGGLVSVELQSHTGIRIVGHGNATRAIAQYDKDQYFVVLPDFGVDKLNIVDLRTGQLITPRSRIPFLNDMIDLHDHAIIRRDGQGNIWIPQFTAETLTQVHNGTVVRTYQLPASLLHLAINGTQIIFAAGYGDLYSLDPATATIRSLNDKAPIGSYGSINDIQIAPDGRIWIATLNGLLMFDTAGQQLRHFDKADGFPDDQIMCLYPDPSGMLWVGTYSGGLCLLDPETGAVQVFGQKAGLSNETVVAILPDEKGMLWVATYNGLNLVDNTGKVIARLYEDDGLSANEFNRFSSSRTPEGQLLFGSIKGISIIDPEIVKQHLAQYHSPSLYLSGITWYDSDKDQEVTQSIGFDLSRPVRLPAAHRYLYVRFNLTGFTLPEKFQYQYQLEGVSGTGSDAWNALGTQSEIKLAGLPAGDYDLRIRGFDHRGNQAINDVVIPIAASEFFYKRPVFYFLLFLLAAGIAGAWVLRERRKRRELEVIVAQRTSKIRQDKEVIEAQAKQLQELDEVKSRFFTNISHEFRTPLTIIGGMASKVAEDPQRWAVQGLQSIQRNTGMLLNLVNQILDLRKLESGKLQPKWILGDVIPYLNYLAESFHSYAENKDITIQIRLEPETLLMDYDPEMWLRIFSNLLSNAIKYTDPGGSITLTSHITDSGQLSISISDTGRGIPEDKLPRIFDLFYQVDDSATRQGEGTGIGLSLTRELVTLLGGKIGVNSTMGRGSTFHLVLPIYQTAAMVQPTWHETQRPTAGPAAELKAEPAVLPGSAHAADMPTLLIVEDNPDVMQYLSACLEDSYQLAYARDGQEGIERAIESVPDLIVSDVMMPRKDGFTLCDTLKRDARTSHIPIILLTAKADADSRITGLERGADAYLSKPFNERELRVRLSRLLELRKALQARYAQASPVLAPAPADDETVQQEDQFINQFRQVVMDNLSEETFGVPELCREIGMSRTQLHNKIKSLTGQSTTHYVRLIRLTEAQRLMAEHPELNLSQIAYEVGFPGLKYFSKVFSEKFGVAPSQYREQL